MIIINKNSTNTIILELTSVSNLLNPNYLFEFKNDLLNTSYFFTAPDLSNWKCRYNMFDITESNTPDPINGEVKLIGGSYTYNIYESTTITLSISATTGRIISTGKANVNGEQINNIYK
jgi:hypothetical protein